jgi:predicted enzyme involved in methoxymalonyl-ACP biosynthesis
MEDILRRLETLGGKRLIGRYIPTNKNGPVIALYERLGFSKLAGDGQELRYEYRLDGRSFAASTPHIRRTSGTAKSIHGSS